MIRETEHVSYDARYRADIIFTTGKVVSFVSDWKPSHWEEVETRGRVAIDDAVNHAKEMQKKYGLECEVVRVTKEQRRVARVIETTTTSKFSSEHYLKEEK